ncbi:MAG: PaaI family thioesterase [Burkholderiales bacterium]
MRLKPSTPVRIKLSLSKEYGTPLPFIDHLGVERVQNREGRALLALEIKPAFRNSWKAAHGGVIMTMLDSAMSLAARLHLQNAPGGILTIEMNAKFISPGMGSRLSAEGRVIGGGKSTLFCEAEVRDEAGALVAKGMGTLKPLRKKES